MADVSVEFGAKDTGLENTLKTVQDELARLDEKVKGGELSFNELQSTMKKVAQAERLQAQLEGMAQATGDAGNAAGTAAPKVDQIGKETKKAGKEAEDFGEKSKGGFLKMSGAVAAGQLAAEAAMAGIRAAINLAKGAVDEFAAALDLGGRLSDLAARTGEAEGNLLLLERAFQNSGAGAEQVGPSINKLQKFMEDAAQGGATQTQAMEDLGLSFVDLQGKTPIEQMQIFAQRISAIEDPGKRAALAMDVFGRSGGELLPFLTNFSGEIDTAKGQLGGMVDIMNRNAATFDAVSDKVNIAKGKFMEFAAGVLDRVIPSLDAITEALSRIDAAKIGQELADAFLGGENAMNGFQSAVDAFKTGKIREAFEILWESIVLQSLQTANEIYKNLVAAFNSVGTFIGKIFDPSGALVTTILDTFKMVGKQISVGIQRDLAAALGGNWLTEGIALQLNTAANETQIAANKIEDGLKGAAGRIAEQFGNAGREFPQSFSEEYSKAENIFTNLDARAAELKAKQDEITAAVAKTNEEKGKGAPVDQQTADAAAQQATAAQEQAEAAARRIQLQTELNNNIADGNAAEVERIQKLLDAELAQARINKLTEDYIKSGLGAPEALQLATNLVNSEIAAANVKKNVEGAKNELGGAADSARTVKQAIEDANTAKMSEPVKDFKSETADAREQLGKMKDFIGEDLSKMSLSSIVDKLGLDAGALESSESQLEAIKKFISDLGNEDPANVTPEVDVPGSKDNIAKIKEALKETEGTDATPAIDQGKVKEQASAARKTVEDDLKKVEATVTVKPKLDKEALKEEVDMAFASSKGTQYLGDIKGFVEVIKGFVEKIEGKLPMQALAY